MKKVKLDEIRVDSFTTTPEVAAERGTVLGNDASAVTCIWSCVPRYTCPECALTRLEAPPAV